MVYRLSPKQRSEVRFLQLPLIYSIKSEESDGKRVVETEVSLWRKSSQSFDIQCPRSLDIECLVSATSGEHLLFAKQLREPLFCK